MSGKPSERGKEKINLGDSPWKFSKSDPYPSAGEAAFDDSTWEEAGVPHRFNDLDTYQNVSQNKAFQSTVWYRKHVPIEAKHTGQRRADEPSTVLVSSGPKV